eukprot:TRINITY_DN18541_c0_g1_i1.p1 TRINITY_DN18541_c0_g1~~TRINITY_DN18541_c0_g1_i1.p1  ORF type:complete len:882 (+),score=205.14 TRINITY_DN18541_c0_g1_i1:39-2684(+)
MTLDELALARVEQHVNSALTAVRRVLDTTKNPKIAASVDHTYDDKFTLLNHLTKLLQSSLHHFLEVLGLKASEWAKLKQWHADHKTVTIRFEFRRKCDFLRKATREVADDVKHVTTTTTSQTPVESTSTRTETTITKVTEWFWKYSVDYEMIAYADTNIDEKVVLNKCTPPLSLELKTLTDSSPYPSNATSGPFEVSINWLLLSDHKINRSHELCRTPSNNPEVKEAIGFVENISCWGSKVAQTFEMLFGQSNGIQKPIDSAMLQCDTIFSPVLPILDNSGSPGQESLWVSSNRLLEEQQRSVSEKIASLSKALPTEGFVTQGSSLVLVITQSLQQTCQQFVGSVDYIEGMLRNQLIKAIGKELDADDFNEYMEYHHRKILKEGLVKNLSHAVRTGDKNPEGIIGVSREANGRPITAISQQTVNMDPISFELTAASRVTISGTRHIHTWLNYNFGSHTASQMFFTARARQFSSFIIIAGKLGPNNSFLPTASIIVRNKDELIIPLELETIPPPKEFKKSIESLSPEQKKFASAYRAMQLAGTLCGICVVEVKPQLEKVLNLPKDSLTKEIELTEKLLELIIKYNISTDLLSFDSDVDIPVSGNMEDSCTSHKLSSVKRHVEEVNQMIEQAKKEEIREAEMKESRNRKPKARPSSEWMYSLDEEVMPDREMPDINGCNRDFSFDDSSSCASRVSGACIQPARSLPKQQQQQHSPDQQNHRTDCSQSAQNILDLPMILEKRMEILDPTSSLRPTIIKIGDSWERSSQKGLLSPPKTECLDAKQLTSEHNKCFDLLDALTKSGAIPVEDVNFHILLSATHCFTNSLMETVYQDNQNPIERVESSTLIIAPTVLNCSTASLLLDEHVVRVKGHSPMLFESDLKLK